MDRSVLARKPVTELKDIAAHLDMKGYQRLRKADLIDAIIANANGAAQAPRAEPPGEREEDASGDEESTRRRVRARRRSDEEGASEIPADEGPARPRKARKTEAPERRPEPAEEPEAEAGTAPEEGEDEDDEDGIRRRRTRRERRRRQRERTAETGAEVTELRAGVLDILPEGYGFLRTTGYLPGDRDAYVSQGMIRKHGLRRGDVVQGPIRPQRQGEKVPALQHVQKVNGLSLEDQGVPARRDFRDLTPLFPRERLRLETSGGPVSMRIIDLMAPIGKGQRGLIVSPPKAGKTTLLKHIGQAITANNPECHLMVVLVDERPEEVTDMERSIDGEVIASTFDRPADEHTQIAELALERAKRLVELGHDVVILLDSVTRLARAYNLAAPASGRIMSGGVDSSALYPPKRFFGAARNLEEGGSLTIIASALIETGSKMDEVIFEEFKGTGNCEIRLDRRLEQKRIFPAIDVGASGTRKEELLLDAEELDAVWKLRRVLHALEPHAAMELLIDKMKATERNDKFLVQIAKSHS